MQRQRSSNSISSFKSSSNSCSSTPKHKASVPVNASSSHYEKSSCFKGDSVGGSSIGSGSVRNKKLSRVEFDFSYQKCNNIDNDLKHESIKYCPKHSCCNQIVTSTSSSSSVSNPIDIPKRKSATLHQSNDNFPMTSKSFTIYETMNRVHKPMKMPNCLDHKTHPDSRYTMKNKCESLDLLSSNIQNVKTKATISATVSSSLDETIHYSKPKSSLKPLSYNRNNINLDNFKSAKRKVPIKQLTKLSSQLNHLEIQAMKEKIAQAEIFLEAMGNATTQRNKDSSRYGKYFDVEVDYRGDLIGGHIMHCKF